MLTMPIQTVHGIVFPQKLVRARHKRPPLAKAARSAATAKRRVMAASRRGLPSPATVRCDRQH